MKRGGKMKKGRKKNAALPVIYTIAMDLVAIAATSAATTTAAAITTAAAATTAAAVAAAASTTAAATATAARTLFLRTSLVDGQRAAIMLLAIESGNRSLCFRIATHLNEAESLAATGFTIRNHLGRLNRAMLAEELFQIRAAGVIAQVPDIQLIAHC
jgi:hypothetical protein